MLGISLFKKDEKPTKDCMVLVYWQDLSVIRPMSYTVAGGWNTHYNHITGKLETENIIKDPVFEYWAVIDGVEDTNAISLYDFFTYENEIKRLIREAKDKENGTTEN